MKKKHAKKISMNKKHVRNAILILLALVLVSKLIYFFAWHEVWWDSGVYVGMGKHIWSAGESGLLEHIRPPFWPLTLGFFWKLGLSPVFFGRLLEIILFLGIIWLVYKLTSSWFEERVGLIAAAIVSFSSIFYHLGFHLYTEIPAVFLVLLAIYLFEKKAVFTAGIITGLAFLTKFPTLLFFIVLGLVLIFRKEFRSIIPLTIGFVLPIVPFFISNFVFYGSFFEPLLAANEVILRALGCNVLRYKPWLFYFQALFSSETKLHLFGILGLLLFFKEFSKKRLILLFSLVLPLAYFIQLHCRDYRYATLFIPFVACFTAFGLVFLFDLIFKNIKGHKIIFCVLTTLVLLFTFHTANAFYRANEPAESDLVAQRYFYFLQNKTVEGEIWVSNPIISAYTDLRLEKIYYPIFGESVAADFSRYLKEHGDKISYVFLDNCGGGLICHPEDAVCKEQTEKLIAQLDEGFIKVFDEENKGCWYKIYAKT